MQFYPIKINTGYNLSQSSYSKIFSSIIIIYIFGIWDFGIEAPTWSHPNLIWSS